ncbi:hypothetical protein F4167_03950 [Candidatus Poribacteria bacterium]|nr:hypothetical protein [Candidatus Poribacteria bacterium]MYG05766.1 hypothetical protein [Candidatus Poribacteria bacterium]
MNNQANSNKSNSVDSFQRILSLAEFGVKRIEERRTVEFRIFISYITLLVLALYQLSKQQNSIHDFFKSIIPKDSVNLKLWEGIILYALVLCIHIIYVIWQVGIGIAMDNDSYRRNFYLKKAEEISGHPLKYENFDSGNKIKPITNYLQQFKYLWIIWADWSRVLLVVPPTLLFIIVVHFFFKNTDLESVWFSGINIFMFLVLIVASIMQKRCNKRYLSGFSCR